MLTETQDNEQIIARVAALDIGKAELVCCVRVPEEDRPGKRLQEVETYSTMTRPLLGMADHLRCLGVTRVVMEATSDYRKPVFYLLEAAGFETWLVNARDVKHLPGRPKTGQARRCLAVQGRRTADDPAELRAAPCVPAAAGCHPLPR
jgi:transposase